MIHTVQRGQTHTEAIDFVMEECCNCHMPFFMPAYLKCELKGHRRGEWFYCPNGHAQHYTGKSELQKSLEAKEAELKQEKEAKTNYMNLFLDQVGQTTKLKNQLKRVHKGVCPCCNRSFQNLKRHIEIKHPEIVK